MKYITSVDDEEFNTPEAAMRYIFNHYGSEALREKFEEGISDILETIDTDSYISLFKEYIERKLEEANDAFEFDGEDSFTTIFGETIEIV